MHNDRKQHGKCCIADNCKIGKCKIVFFIYEVEYKIHSGKQKDQSGKIPGDKSRSHELKNGKHAANTNSIDPGVSVKSEIIQIFYLYCPHVKTNTNDSY